MPVPVSVKLAPEIKARVKKLAERKERSPHWLMREAITRYVEQEEKREAFRQTAVAAWEEFKATGRHVRHEDVDAWLSNMEEGKDEELPECRD